ncbi:MAG TPA: MFS transporter [Micromonosporaceae bacterium]
MGSGTFLTGSVVFFTQVVGLTPVQIGIGFSLVGMVGLFGSLPLGHLADRIGGQRAWVAGALLEAAAFVGYPFAHGFWSFVFVIVAGSIGDVVASGGRTVYIAAALPVQIRVRAMAFMRAYLNVGFTVGAGLGAAALALRSDGGLIAMALLNAAGLAVNAAVVSRMPAVTAERVTQGRVSPWGVLRDHPYTALATVFAVVWLHGMLGALFGLNTVMAVLLQVPATRGADTAAGSVRLMRRAGVASAVACPVIALSGATRGWVTVGVLALSVVLTTATELWSSAAQWYFQTELPPADQRGAYLGANRSVMGVSRMVGPAALTFLAIQTGGWGWWVIAVLFVACVVATQPVVAWVQRTPRNGAAVPSGSAADAAVA